RQYLKGKLLNVLLPYVIVSTPALVVKALAHRGPFNPASAHHDLGVAKNAIWAVLSGYPVFAPFWFIPMIAVIYLLAPLWLWIDRRPWMYLTLPGLLSVTTIIHRPGGPEQIWHSLLYFAPIYVYGMWFSRYKETLLAWHDRWFLRLVFLLIALIWFEVGFARSVGDFVSTSVLAPDGRVGTNAIQKLVICGVLLAALRRCGQQLHQKLRFVGEASLGIYFVHMYFIQAGAEFLSRSKRPFVGLSISVAAVMLLSGALLWIARRMLGRRSRLLVGY
ncbi:MAG: acyltransferase, partial [Vicinamibacterales bacterium]